LQKLCQTVSAAAKRPSLVLVCVAWAVLSSMRGFRVCLHVCLSVHLVLVCVLFSFCSLFTHARPPFDDPIPSMLLSASLARTRLLRHQHITVSWYDWHACAQVPGLPCHSPRQAQQPTVAGFDIHRRRRVWYGCVGFGRPTATQPCVGALLVADSPRF
jgi:hypothetical protein